MKNYRNQYVDPVNYIIDWSELKNYSVFLDELTDVPESKPLNNVTITEAWITNQVMRFNIKWFEWEVVTIYANIEIWVWLDSHRWIHMSRCEEALFWTVDTVFDTLSDVARYLWNELIRLQSSDSVSIKLDAVYLHHHRTHKTNKISFDKIYLISEYSNVNWEINTKTWVKAYNITACPCTRTYTKFSVVPKLLDYWLTIDQVNKVLNTALTWTHTQRWTVSLILSGKDLNVSHFELYNVLNDSTHLIFDLLKRPDEHDLVVRALSKPQFTEDVWRDVSFQVCEKLTNKVSDATHVYIESILYDSIHIHDVRTVISKSFKELYSEIY
jgi:GTP cyclohydrolase FolE2